MLAFALAEQVGAALPWLLSAAAGCMVWWGTSYTGRRAGFKPCGWMGSGERRGCRLHQCNTFLILRSDIVVRILPIVFGLFVIFDSLGRIQNALDLRRCEYPSWKGFLLLPVLSVVLGVVMILNPFGTMETLVMAIGIILIIEGAINLLSALYTVLAIRRFAKLHPETQSMLESLTGQDLNGDGVIAPDIAPADVEASAVELDHVDESAEVEQEED